jgi:hypothetical protein
VAGETAVWVDEIVIGDGLNAVEPAWLEMVRQDGRAASSDTLNVEAVVGYDLSSLAEGEYVLKLHYANPNWESINSGRVPMDGMSDFIPLTEMQGSLTIHFTGNPQELQSIVGVDEPVLVLMLAKIDGGSFEPYLMETYESFPLLLHETDEVTYVFREDNSE